MLRFVTMLCLFGLITPALAGEASPPKDSPAPKLSSEKRERGIFKAGLANYLRNGQFDELEKAAATLIKDDPRYACGVSKLVDLYDVLDPAYPSGPDGPDARVASFTAWDKARPDSHWPKVGFSRVEAWRAYEARGTSRASEVSQEQWEEHDRHIKLAMEWGKKALASDPGDPELFTHMIGLCRAAQCPRDQVDRWMAAALAINPKFDAVFIPIANTLVPRWLGNPDAFVDFAEKASDDNKALGNIAYARIATVAMMIDGEDLRATYPRLSWDRIQDGLRQIDKRYPGSTRTFHLLARFASLYGDRAVAREAFAKLKTGWRADADYWGRFDAFQRAYVWAMDEPPGPF